MPRSDWIRVENTHEPLVDRGLWETVQKQMTVNREVIALCLCEMFLPAGQMRNLRKFHDTEQLAQSGRKQCGRAVLWNIQTERAGFLQSSQDGFQDPGGGGEGRPLHSAGLRGIVQR